MNAPSTPSTLDTVLAQPHPSAPDRRIGDGLDFDTVKALQAAFKLLEEERDQYRADWLEARKRAAASDSENRSLRADIAGHDAALPGYVREARAQRLEEAAAALGAARLGPSPVWGQPAQAWLLGLAADERNKR